MSSNLFWYTGGMIERAQETQRESMENCGDTKIHKERKNKTDVHRGGGGRKKICGLKESHRGKRVAKTDHEYRGRDGK